MNERVEKENCWVDKLENQATRWIRNNISPNPYPFPRSCLRPDKCKIFKWYHFNSSLATALGKGRNKNNLWRPILFPVWFYVTFIIKIGVCIPPILGYCLTPRSFPLSPSDSVTHSDIRNVARLNINRVKPKSQEDQSVLEDMDLKSQLRVIWRFRFRLD